MTTYQHDYLSEFEQEFDLEDNENTYELPADNYSAFEMADEFGSDSEMEADQEDPGNENRMNETDSRDREFEERLYSAFNSEYESSFEMEQELDQVLHEMETEYFFNGFKKFVGNKVGKLKKLAGQFLPKNTLQALMQLGGGNLRGLLKSDLFKKGLSFAANAVAPGFGGAIAGGLLNSETGNPSTARQQAREAVQTAKTAYQQMARNLVNLKPGDLNTQINSMSRHAMAVGQTRPSPMKGKRRKTIPLPPGSAVVVRNNRVTIYY